MYGNFDGVGLISYWWSSTESDNGNSWVRCAYYLYNEFPKSTDGKPTGQYVRCIKDN